MVAVARGRAGPWVLVGALAMLHGCGLFRTGDSATDIKVERQGSGYTFSFGICGDRWQQVGASAIDVIKLSSNETVCQISLSKPATLVSTWSYGAVPPGYAGEQCAALEAGEGYEVRASAGLGGVQKFSLERDGSVRLGKGMCNR